MSNISYLVQDLMKIIETHKQTLLPNAYSDLTATLDWHSADRFSTLAPEILMVIFSKVKRPGDLLSLTKTCKNFDNILSTHDSCWRSLAESKFPSNSGLSLQELYDEVQKIDIVKELHDEMRNMGASEEMCADIKINILNDWKWLACTLFHTMKPMQLDGYDHAYQLGKWWKMCIASTRPTYKAGAKVCILAGNYINTINDGEYTLGNVCWSGNKIVFEDEGILRYKGMLKGTEFCGQGVFVDSCGFVLDGKFSKSSYDQKYKFEGTVRSPQGVEITGFIDPLTCDEPTTWSGTEFGGWSWIPKCQNDKESCNKRAKTI